MVCLSCNRQLNNYESTRKYKGTNTFIDLCSHCFNGSELVNVSVTDRPELANTEDFIEEFEE